MCDRQLLILLQQVMSNGSRVTVLTRLYPSAPHHVSHVPKASKGRYPTRTKLPFKGYNAQVLESRSLFLPARFPELLSYFLRSRGTTWQYLRQNPTPQVPAQALPPTAQAKSRKSGAASRPRQPHGAPRSRPRGPSTEPSANASVPAPGQAGGLQASAGRRARRYLGRRSRRARIVRRREDVRSSTSPRSGSGPAGRTDRWP